MNLARILFMDSMSSLSPRIVSEIFIFTSQLVESTDDDDTYMPVRWVRERNWEGQQCVAFWLYAQLVNDFEILFVVGSCTSCNFFLTTHLKT